MLTAEQFKAATKEVASAVYLSGQLIRYGLDVTDEFPFRPAVAISLAVDIANSLKKSVGSVEAMDTEITLACPQPVRFLGDYSRNWHVAGIAFARHVLFTFAIAVNEKCLPLGESPEVGVDFDMLRDTDPVVIREAVAVLSHYPEMSRVLDRIGEGRSEIEREGCRVIKNMQAQQGVGNDAAKPGTGGDGDISAEYRAGGEPGAPVLTADNIKRIFRVDDSSVSRSDHAIVGRLEDFYPYIYKYSSFARYCRTRKKQPFDPDERYKEWKADQEPLRQS